MNCTNKYFSILSIVLVLLAITQTSCTESKTDKTEITVSILPQKYIVNQLLGDSIKVNVMVLPGNSPATYSPTPSQIKNLHSSKLYLRIGHIGFEQNWMDKITSIDSDIIIADVSEGVQLIKGEAVVHGDHVHEGGIDPHIWTSPRTMLTVITNTKDALVKHFPEHSALIEKNYPTLLEKVKALDLKFTESFKPHEGSKFLIFHPAYTYLAQDYNLEQISIENDGKEPSVKWLQTIIEKAKANNINAIFIQKEFDSRNAELVAKELDIDIISVNPLAEDWITEINNTLNTLVNSFQQD
ncbi:metal ABC transporter solute-binding protein, Zn/Mn family [Saccharicrinis aurantiacus]|uniref:metal ABC transporter solute-binding protein, Zn/Mn family n=1 Tax=Saccharicrinis aurantiacus TaxID=1849719 RepID=UPI0024926FB4|nr:zinc ABC transporter substrate-binding protein [Saccharicrinis aurantiacus]